MSLDVTLDSIEAAYRDWGEYLANPNFIRAESSITWQNREKIWLQDEFDHVTYAEIRRKRQYSFVISEDGGLIQLYYEFHHDNQKLKSASVSYYGSSVETLISDPGLIDTISPVDSRIDEFEDDEVISAQAEVPEFVNSDLDEFENDQNKISEEKHALVSFIPNIRLDYTPGAARHFVHEKCHLHISGLVNTRVHVNVFPTPEQFIEMVFAWFYPDTYEKRFNLLENTEQFDPEAFKRLRVESHKEKWLTWEVSSSASMLPWLHFSGRL